MLHCPRCKKNAPLAAGFCDACGVPLLQQDGRTVYEIKRWLIGSAPECDLTDNHPQVSAWHCLLSESGTGFSLEDLASTNGTYVNGQRIEFPTSVTRKDTITLGRTTPLPWPALHSPPQTTLCRIGREADNDIVLDFEMVSAYHARILMTGGRTILQDLNSTNGTALGDPNNKIKLSPLTKQQTVWFGSYQIKGAALLARVGSPNSRTEIPFTGGVMTLGRDPASDQVLDYPMVSWHHARLERQGDIATVTDLGATNGTYVNGQRITGKVVVRPGDVIGLGSYTFRLTSTGGIEKRDYRGDLTIEANAISVAVPGKRLLEDVSLTIYPSELVGLMGPSGAGKSTLMMAFNGYTPPTEGQVFFNGEDLYSAYGHFCSQIGYVPQDDIMHRDLTVRQALYYTAKLRLPKDTTEEELEQRIQQILTQLGLQGVQDVIIGSPEKKGISGGQRKRVNLAMELLTDPSVLFLDEPTSGLSSEDALMVMKLLRELANSGKTILITIHQPSLESFRLMDQLIVVAKDSDTVEPGRLVYFGPAYPNSILFFNPEPQTGPMQLPDNLSPDKLLRGLHQGRTTEWLRRYDLSEYKRHYVNDRAGQAPEPATPTSAPQSIRRPGLSQWRTLVRRSLVIKLKDSASTLILLAQAPIIAFLLVAVFSHRSTQSLTRLTYPDISNAMVTSSFLLIISALWFGCANAAREIVGEWAIYHRERMVNLKIPSYIASKFTVLGLLCLVQCAALLGIVYWGCGWRGPWWKMYWLLVLTALVGVALGLTASVLARTSEVALSLVPLILLPMIILGGGLSPLHNMKAEKYLPPILASRWAFEGLLLLEATAWPTCQDVPSTEKNPTVAGVSNFATPCTMVVDMAHSHFPAEENKVRERTDLKTCLLVLGSMLAALVAGIIFILRWRDVH